MIYQEFSEQMVKGCSDLNYMHTLTSEYLKCRHSNKSEIIISCFRREGEKKHETLRWVNYETRSKNVSCTGCVIAKENVRPLHVEDTIHAFVNVYFLVS